MSDTGVYVSYACIQAYDFEPATGAPIWHHSGPCEGGGGRTPVLSNGRVWTRDDAGGSPLALNAATGALVSSYGAGPAPAFDNHAGFFLNGGALNANGYVYVGSTRGQLWALDETTGTPVWSDNVGAAILAPDEHNVSSPLTGSGRRGLVVAPASNLLVAHTGRGRSVRWR